MSPRICLICLMLCAGLKAQVAVVSAASFRGDQPVTNGAWVSAFPTPSGSTFTGVSTATAPTYPLPKTLNGVTVTVDGVDAPVEYVASNVINFLIPYAVAPGLRSVQLKTPGGTLNGSVRIITSAPAIFTLDTQVPPQGAIRNADSSINASSNAAKRGEIIQIYGSGPGALTQPVQDGAAAPSNPVVNTISTPQVFFAGVPAEVQFSGLTPTIAGLWQINVTVPSQSFLTGRVPVIVFMDGVDSNEVAVFVQ